MKEIWEVSDQKINNANGSSRQSSHSSSVIIFWWVFYLVNFFVGKIARRLYTRDESIGTMITDSWMLLISDAIGIMASLSIIYLVRAIDQKQEEKHANLMAIG